MNEPNMPKVPPSIWISLVTAVLGVLTAFGLDLNDLQQTSIVTLAGVVATVIPLADAWLRRGRLDYLARRDSAARVTVNNEVSQ